MKDALPSLHNSQVALDGKALRGSRTVGLLLYLVSAFAADCRWVLAQQEVVNKSNEIKAIPDLLNMLDLKGAVVTMDAMGCQKSIIEIIHTQKADYVVALKDNHPTLCADVELWLNQEFDQKRLHVHEEGGKFNKERRYYLSSIKDLNRFAALVRGHWSIENQQHWILDVQFHEELNQTRNSQAAANLALMRRFALNLLHNDENKKKSIRSKKMHAMMNDAYCEQLLFSSPKTS